MFLFFFQLFWTPAESCSSSLKPKGIQRYLSLSCSLSPWSFSLFKPYNDKSLLFYFPSTQNDFFSFPKLILLINKADNLSACFGTERFIFTKNGKRGKKENWDRKVEKKKKTTFLWRNKYFEKFLIKISKLYKCMNDTMQVKLNSNRQTKEQEYKIL